MPRFEEFEKLGGRGMLIKISKIFYDKIYLHPWIGLYFKDISQDVIESQQVDFMTGALGGDQIYLGKLPIPAHKHMFITEELFELRQTLLEEALEEAGASEDLKNKWLKIDDAFKKKMIKSDISECEKRFHTDEILAFKKIG